MPQIGRSRGGIVERTLQFKNINLIIKLPLSSRGLHQPSRRGPQGPAGSIGGRSGRNGWSDAGDDQGPASAAGLCSSAAGSPGGGNAIGLGSCPPAKRTSASTRLSTDGWVENRSEKPVRGLSTHISITAEVAPGSSPRPSILRSAEIMASGFLVSSTEPESARNSRERESASRMNRDKIHAIAINATAIRIASPAPPRPRPLSPPRRLKK